MTINSSENKKWKYIYAIGGVASLSIASIFFFALIELMTGTFNFFQDNFVIRLIKLHVHYDETLDNMLKVVNILDMFILVLVTITAVAMYHPLGKINRNLAILTVIQPFIGMLLFLVTQEAGRTTTFSTALTISAIMLWNNRSDKVALMGLISAVLILIPDISFMFTYSGILAIMMSAGYLLFIPWWFLLSIKLFKDFSLK